MCGLFRGPGPHPVEPKRDFETQLLFLTKTWSLGVGTHTNLLSKTLLLTYRKCAWEGGLFLTLRAGGRAWLGQAVALPTTKGVI